MWSAKTKLRLWTSSIQDLAGREHGWQRGATDPLADQHSGGVPGGARPGPEQEAGQGQAPGHPLPARVGGGAEKGVLIQEAADREHEQEREDQNI